jgi:hypothetical protein
MSRRIGSIATQASRVAAPLAKAIAYVGIHGIVLLLLWVCIGLVIHYLGYPVALLSDFLNLKESSVVIIVLGIVFLLAFEDRVGDAQKAADSPYRDNYLSSFMTWSDRRAEQVGNGVAELVGITVGLSIHGVMFLGIGGLVFGGAYRTVTYISDLLNVSGVILVFVICLIGLGYMKWQDHRLLKRLKK